MKRLKIDLEDLCIALDGNPGEDMKWFLDTEAGDTILVTAEYDPAELDGPTLDELQSQPERYLPVPAAHPAQSREDMQAFLASLSDPRLRESLEIALGGPRPSRHFKQVLEHLPEQRQSWLDFKRARLMERARTFLAAHGLAAIPGGGEKR